ncbi:MAG: methyltransferase domain-containing protein [Gammaproteobacteria bacterium]|nr:methyltransferase domain-containing protein [Gammaproteobacteria bacterium]
MGATRNISLEVALRWQSDHATHIDRQYFEKINLWRDYFPQDLSDRLNAAAPGDVIMIDVAVGELVAPFDPALVQRMKRHQFNTQPRPGMQVEPRVGRFYPATFFDTPLFFYGDYRPSRIRALDAESLEVDFNHPLARYAAQVEARIIKDLGASAERGGRCNDIAQELVSRGPGMQAPLPDVMPDYSSGDVLARLDPREDAVFYQSPRLVQHIDATARAQITEIYSRFLQPGMRVLDLMSSWQSHLPEPLTDLQVTGLGMNAQELAENPRLSESIVHDLNVQPQLPFAAGSFDAVICTVSVEYLVQPIEVFRDIARILKPGAPFILTFSDRWFPTKAIELWSDLHAFERLGLVLDYFRRAGGFVDLGTESLRGLPRPEDDPYADKLAHSDPVFAVWGRRAP